MSRGMVQEELTLLHFLARRDLLSQHGATIVPAHCECEGCNIVCLLNETIHQLLFFRAVAHQPLLTLLSFKHALVRGAEPTFSHACLHGKSDVKGRLRQLITDRPSFFWRLALNIQINNVVLNFVDFDGPIPWNFFFTIAST